MINIIKKIIPESLYPLKCTFGMSPDRLCIHNTANDASAENEARYVHNNSAATSYHFAVDDKQAVQILPLDRNGWHAGDGALGAGNRKSIGIEICYSLSGGARFDKAQENAAELCAYLMHEYGWGLDLSRITKHEDYAKKHCPHRTLDDYGWEYFINLVKDKYNKLYGGELPMTQEEKKYYEEKIEALEARLKEYDDMGVYENAAIRWAYIDGNLPKWATPTIKKLVHNDFLKGNSANSFELSYLFMRVWVILDRMGLIDFAINLKKKK